MIDVGFSQDAGRSRERRFVGRYASVAHQWFASGVVLPWHQHPHASIWVVLSGSLVESWGVTQAEYGAGEVIYRPPAIPHANEFRDTEVLALEVDARRLEADWGFQRLPPSPRAQFEPRIRVVAGNLVRELAALDRDRSAAIRLEGLTLELIGESCRATLGAAKPDAPRWLLQVEQRLRAEFTRPASVGDYARNAGVHPAHLIRTFRTYYGASMGRLIRKLRVEYAARALTQGTATLAEIARSAGFADQSHFTHAFRRETGVTPGRYRRETAPMLIKTELGHKP